MTSRVNGFVLEVTTPEGVPNIRVSLSDGTVVFATDKVSVTGLYNLPAVVEMAASMARRGLERYYEDRRRGSAENA